MRFAFASKHGPENGHYWAEEHCGQRWCIPSEDEAKAAGVHLIIRIDSEEGEYCRVIGSDEAFMEATKFVNMVANLLLPGEDPENEKACAEAEYPFGRDLDSEIQALYALIRKARNIRDRKET
jgi:hypothetical protein